MAKKRYDVAIIGAGLAGSSLAGLLAEWGWRVVLLERQRFPRHKVCGEFLSPESQTSLKALGLTEVVAALSPARITQARLVSRAGVTVQTALPGSAWGISRFALDAALAATARQRGVELRTGTTAVGVQPVAGGVEVALRSRRGSTAIQARTVIAACGRYSRPGLPPGPGSPPQQALVGVKCHYQDISMPGRVELFFFPGGYAGISPIEGNRVNCCLLATPDALARAGKRIPAMLELAAAGNPALARRLSGGQALPETAVAVAPVDTQRRAAPWDGMACLGDTAVMIPPLCGDGMAMALRSVELCAPLAHAFLRQRLTLAEWEAVYGTAWHREFDRPVRVGRYLQTILSLPLLSDLFLGLGYLVPALPTALVRATRGRRSGMVSPEGN